MNLYGSKIFGGEYWNTDQTHRMEMGSAGRYGVFRLYNLFYGDVPYFSVSDNGLGEVEVVCTGDTVLFYDGRGTVKPKGIWDFTGVETNGLTAVFK